MSTTALPQYVTTGSGPVTVFLLHGAYGGPDYFEDLTARYVADGFRVVAWTCPGYGAEPVPDGFGIPLATEYAVNLVRKESGDVNVLLGHSMGGLIGPLAAGRLGADLDGLVLSAAGTGFVNRTEEDKERYLEERVKPISGGLNVGEYAPSLIAKMMAPGAAGPLVDRVVEVVSAMKTEAFLASMRAITEYNSIPALEAVTIPTLLIAGEFDPVCPPVTMTAMHAMIDGSVYHEVAGSGHYAFAEVADEYYRVTSDFIKDVASR